MFTVLNTTRDFTPDQVFNVYSFSMLYAWLHSLYRRPHESHATGKEEERKGEGEDHFKIVRDLFCIDHFHSISSPNMFDHLESLIHERGLRGPRFQSVPSPLLLHNSLIQFPSRLKASTSEKIIAYCGRVIDQSGLALAHSQNGTPSISLAPSHPGLHSFLPILFLLTYVC